MDPNQILPNIAARMTSPQETPSTLVLTPSATPPHTRTGVYPFGTGSSVGFSGFHGSGTNFADQMKNFFSTDALVGSPRSDAESDSPHPTFTPGNDFGTPSSGGRHRRGHATTSPVRLQPPSSAAAAAPSSAQSPQQPQHAHLQSQGQGRAEAQPQSQPQTPRKSPPLLPPLTELLDILGSQTAKKRRGPNGSRAITGISGAGGTSTTPRHRVGFADSLAQATAAAATGLPATPRLRIGAVTPRTVGGGTGGGSRRRPRSRAKGSGAGSAGRPSR